MLLLLVPRGVSTSHFPTQLPASNFGQPIRVNYVVIVLLHEKVITATLQVATPTMDNLISREQQREKSSNYMINLH